jgi:hypothetical protein
MSAAVEASLLKPSPTCKFVRKSRLPIRTRHGRGDWAELQAQVTQHQTVSQTARGTSQERALQEKPSGSHRQLTKTGP